VSDYPQSPSQEQRSPKAQCSARGCRAAAGWVLVWNNPKLHQSDYEKRWLACDDHRGSLSGFLGLRGFLRRVEQLPPDQLPGRTAPK